MTEQLLSEMHGAVAVLTLNRPAAMNALSCELRAGLVLAIDAIAADPAIRAVVLTGAGERAFCAGLDLRELGAAGGLDAVVPDRAMDPVGAIERCPKPFIGAVNGVAITGGLELALACDFLIAADGARFADTHSRVGLLPGWGLSVKLARLIGLGRAKEMSLTGNFVDAATGERWGLINCAVPQAELLHTAIRLAQDIASATPEVIHANKRLIDDGYALTYGAARELERSRSRDFAAAHSPDDIAARVGAVQARGRAQAGN
jgi:enoyl-CoA hydratase